MVGGRRCVKSPGDLWNSIHGDDAWERNDWCWCISFEVVK